jgi:hypothetical protein
MLVALAFVVFGAADPGRDLRQGAIADVPVEHSR